MAIEHQETDPDRLNTLANAHRTSAIANEKLNKLGRAATSAECAATHYREFVNAGHSQALLSVASNLQFAAECFRKDSQFENAIRCATEAVDWYLKTPIEMIHPTRKSLFGLLEVLVQSNKFDYPPRSEDPPGKLIQLMESLDIRCDFREDG